MAESFARLKAAFEKSTDKAEQRKILRRLGSIRDHLGVVEFLGDVLSSRRSASLKAAAAQSLGKSRSSAAGGALLRALADDNSAVRNAAAAAFQHLPAAEFESRLSELAAPTNESILGQIGAMTALLFNSPIGAMTAAEFRTRQECAQRLVKIALGTGSEEVREACFASLEHLVTAAEHSATRGAVIVAIEKAGRSELVPILDAGYQQAKTDEARAGFARVLEKLAPKRARRHLIEQLDRGLDDEQLAMLAKVADGKAVEPLLAAIAKPGLDAQAKKKMAAILGKIPGEESRDGLLELLRSNDPDIASAALTGLHDRMTADVLAHQLDEAKETQAAIAVALRPWLKREHRSLRAWALGAIGNGGDPADAVPILLKHVKLEDFRQAALTSLALLIKRAVGGIPAAHLDAITRINIRQQTMYVDGEDVVYGPDSSALEEMARKELEERGQYPFPAWRRLLPWA